MEEKTRGKVVFVSPDEARVLALRHARGCYQQGILYGSYSLSGADLRGRAKDYAGRYATSRNNLLKRIKEAGIPIKEVWGEHNKRVLVFGTEAAIYAFLAEKFPKGRKEFLRLALEASNRTQKEET